MTKLLPKKAKISVAILMLAITLLMVFPFNAEAQTSSGVGQYIKLPVDIPTFLFVDASPNPVGVNQTMYISAIFAKPLPTSQGTSGDFYLGITAKITDPDGQVITLGPFDGGMIGGFSASWVPTKVGNYTIQAFYPGQILTRTNPLNSVPGGYHAELNGSRALPSQSTILSFTVQEQPVTGPYYTPALPTQYWARPINALNWAWGAQAGSNWLGLAPTGFCVSGQYDASGSFQPYGTAPNTAHILWSQSLREGGQPGGPISSDPTTAFSTTSVVMNMYDGAICINGIAYINQHYGWSGTVYGWKAIDMRTGATVWEKPAGITGSESLKCGFLFNVHSYQQYGTMAYLMTTGTTETNRGTVVRLYDAWTGEFVRNMTNARNLNYIVDNAPLTAATIQGTNYRGYDQQGGLLGWFIEDGNLKRWNSTYLFSSSSAIGVSTTSIGNGESNWTRGVDQVIPLPTENNLNSSLSISRITNKQILLRFCPTFSYQGSQMGWQVTMAYDAMTGQKLWGPLNQTLPFLEDIAPICARDDVYINLNKDQESLTCYSLKTGELLWGPSQMLWNGNSRLDTYAEIAYGKVYTWDMGGIVQAFDLKTGARVWNWSRGSAGYDNSRGVYEMFGYLTHSIADGKLFLQEGVMYTPPLHPARRTVLNCTDGTLVWDILSYSARAGSVVADGELLEWDSFDAKLYAFGQGATATTVTAPNTEVPLGSSITVTGTVTDLSAGSQQEGVIENFPHGLPAISDASMSKWMEHVYKQQDLPSNTIGVPVSLDVVDANNNLRHIGDTTSDVTGTFSYIWKPDIPGAYKLVATFQGTQSYYGSSAETFFNVGDAPQSTSEPATTPLSSVADTYFLPAVSGIVVILIVIIALLAMLLLRRRP